MVIWAAISPLLKVLNILCTGSEQGSRGHLGSCNVNMLTMHCVSGIYGVQNICNQIVLWFSRHLHMQGGNLSAYGADYIRNHRIGV